jgi:hypothetical protein
MNPDYLKKNATNNQKNEKKIQIDHNRIKR